MQAAADERRALAIFARLWAAAALFHVGSFDLWSESAPVALAAVWLLARPGSLPALLGFAVLQIADVWIQLPIIPNHWLLCAFADGTLLLGFAWLARAGGTARVDAADLYRVFAPPVRAGLIAMYVLAVLHKLNSDFLAPEVSCAAEFYRAQADAFPWLPAGPFFESAAIYLTLATESAIPLLLVWRATRTAGIVLGLVFHGVLAFNPISGFYNFSAILVAFYFLFIPPRVVACAREQLRGSAPMAALAGLRGRLAGRRLLAAAALAGVGLCGASGLFAGLGSRGFFLVLWVPYGLAALVLAVGCLPWSGRDEGAGDGEGTFRIAPAFLGLPLALLVANGLSPYLGLKTETSFAMFSNLRTEGGETNHLFIPTATQVFGYQRDLVRVLETPEPGMRLVARLDRVMPFLEFRGHMSRHPEVPITYERRGERVELARAGDDPELTRPLPLLARKLLSFRTVDRQGPQRCVH